MTATIMNSRKPIALAMACLFAISLATPPARAVRNLKPGDAIPDFSLPRADGAGQIDAKQLAGKPAVIIFWRPQQELSLQALTDLQALAKQVGADKFNLIAVDAKRSSPNDVQAALAGKTFTFPILLDPQRDLYGKVGVIVAPTTLLCDADGKLRFVVASRPKQYRPVVQARLQFLLGQISEQAMNDQIKPTVLKIEHDLAAAWRMFNLGNKLRAEGKNGQALAMMEKAVAQKPSLTEAQCTIGFMMLEAGNVQAAQRYFQAALTYRPDSLAAQLGQATVLARTGNDRKAEQLLRPLLSRKSNPVRVRYELGRIYQQRNQLEKAVTFYRDALANLFPEAEHHPAATSPAPTKTKTKPEPTKRKDQGTHKHPDLKFRAK